MTRRRRIVPVTSPVAKPFRRETWPAHLAHAPVVVGDNVGKDRYAVMEMTHEVRLFEAARIEYLAAHGLFTADEVTSLTTPPTIRGTRETIDVDAGREYVPTLRDDPRHFLDLYYESRKR